MPLTILVLFPLVRDPIFEDILINDNFDKFKLMTAVVLMKSMHFHFLLIIFPRSVII